MSCPRYGFLMICVSFHMFQGCRQTLELAVGTVDCPWDAVSLLLCMLSFLLIRQLFCCPCWVNYIDLAG